MSIKYTYVFEDMERVIERSEYEEKLDIFVGSIIKIDTDVYKVDVMNTLFDFDLKTMFYMVIMTKTQLKIGNITGEGVDVKVDTRTHADLFSEKILDSPMNVGERFKDI